jgi:subtilisin family serine protease
VTYIKADQVWARWNITGEGITVGAIGSGVDWTHSDLHDQYLGLEGNHDYTWFDPWEGTTEPVDTNGIGTHTLGTVLGANGIGVAPGAHWIACRSLARDLGNLALYLDCLQFLFAPFPQKGDPFIDGDPTRGAHIVNAAWICPHWEGCDAITLSVAIEHLRNAGQMFVTGAGNDGPACGTIGPPGLAEAALTVGAIDANGTIANFSSRGPITLDSSGRAKPDVVAPGAAIISSLPDGRYAEFDGTSMATSHVAGVVALLWSANPALIGDIERTKQIMAETARHTLVSDLCGAGTDTRNNVYGFGVVDALEAVRVALEP